MLPLVFLPTASSAVATTPPARSAGTRTIPARTAPRPAATIAATAISVSISVSISVAFAIDNRRRRYDHRWRNVGRSHIGRGNVGGSHVSRCRGHISNRRRGNIGCCCRRRINRCGPRRGQCRTEHGSGDDSRKASPSRIAMMMAIMVVMMARVTAAGISLRNSRNSNHHCYQANQNFVVFLHVSLSFLSKTDKKFDTSHKNLIKPFCAPAKSADLFEIRFFSEASDRTSIPIFSIHSVRLLEETERPPFLLSLSLFYFQDISRLWRTSSHTNEPLRKASLLT